MKQNKRYIISIMWVIIGVIQLLRYYRFYHNDVYREKMETELSDERNLFLRNKAFAWAAHLFTLITAVSCIIFRIMGNEALSLYSSFACSLMLMLYWVSYMILKRKY